MDATVPELATAIVPLFMAWALEDRPLPQQPEGDLYRCRNMTGALERLRDRGHTAIYIVWNIKGDEGPERFRWKYLIDSGQTVVLSDSEKADLAERWRAGKRSLPTASFRTHSTDHPSVLVVGFSIFGAAGCRVQINGSGPESRVVVDPGDDMMTWVY